MKILISICIVLGSLSAIADQPIVPIPGTCPNFSGTFVGGNPQPEYVHTIVYTQTGCGELVEEFPAGAHNAEGSNTYYLDGRTMKYENKYGNDSPVFMRAYWDKNAIVVQRWGSNNYASRMSFQDSPCSKAKPAGQLSGNIIEDSGNNTIAPPPYSLSECISFTRK